MPDAVVRHHDRAGLAVLALGVAVVAKRRGALSHDLTLGDGRDVSPQAGSPDGAIPARRHIAPLAGAQLLVALYLLWSFASSRWSAAPDLAVGGSTLLAIYFLWALGIGNGLNRYSAGMACRMLIVITTVTAGVAIWYYYGRNPTLRAKFPYGNPTFLAACLIPGITLTVSLIVGALEVLIARRRGVSVLVVVTALAALLVVSWAFKLSGSRGASVGLIAALLAIMFFALRGRAKVIPLLLASAGLVGAWLYLPSLSDWEAGKGRDASLRLRVYAWKYGYTMFKEKPFTGHGQGGFVLNGDAHAVGDVLKDPLPFEARLAHVHNEWLEVLADLGSTGLVLLAGVLFLTLRAGMTALNASATPSERWTLVGLLGALVGLIVEETFGVGLRVTGVPTMFYTVVGLIWASAGPRHNAVIDYLAARPVRRVMSGMSGIAIAIAVLGITQNDFAAARAAYRAGQALQAEDYGEAIRLAEAATKSRLSPQRTLENIARFSEAQMRVAAVLQRRAIDREARARESDIPDPQLLALAQQDREYSDRHCREGSRALKELVARSPAYFNHGRIEYELNLIQAANAAARQDVAEHDQCLKNAAAAIERELLRRPFHPTVTLEYLRVVGDAITLAETIDLLSRPLRHNRITPSYVDYLAHLTALPGFDGEFRRIVQSAYETTASPAVSLPGPDSSVAWAPEKLRLAATVQFRLGNYESARGILRVAARAYDALARAAPIGAASCYAELADCQFFADPGRPESALASAYRAMSLAPESLDGRRLKENVQRRMVDYYLAEDNEEQAKELLAQLAPPGTAEEAIKTALGARYRGMCEALRDRRLAEILRQPINELLPKLRRWAARAIELSPHDPLAHYLAADLAFYGGECAETAEHIWRAIDNGLHSEAARRFIQAALESREDCKVLQRILTMLDRKEGTESLVPGSAGVGRPSTD
ncbi:MAG: O-antigen ligase family protein [Phycisphaerae bacterium]